MSDTSAPEASRRRMGRADLISGGVFTLLGLAIVYFSWIMPRLEVRGIHPATVPGLVPGLLGGALTVCGAGLAVKSWLDIAGRGGWGDFFALFRSPEAGRAYVAAGLALLYSLVLVGLLPFWLATALFVSVFIFVFEAWLSLAPKPAGRAAIWAVSLGLVTGAVVTFVFQYGFLVRLP
ncbi:tripartite tricarboxylate transporter TctB family protein [Chelativorans sp. AA-79]|uniref:tripartite tricarboxylate transporter TctB family protein n=1 Tax=Chelativorans sp. AA-79 TaxID=3028735 RepID=UPI0023F65F87|nr:tripartite tricarboxylate transporter TctB family protein [Chelativorans sp. AA-79]WEX10131.1 tripartite tricarboxylate transporter TctB family protein [Chelativorans sp. AA-79]